MNSSFKHALPVLVLVVLAAGTAIVYQFSKVGDESNTASTTPPTQSEKSGVDLQAIKPSDNIDEAADTFLKEGAEAPMEDPTVNDPTTDLSATTSLSAQE